MFYTTQTLSRKGPLGLLWIAAHTPGKLKREQVVEASVERAVAQVLYPDVPLALRITAHLLTGIVRVHAKKAVYLQQDCNDALLSLRQAFRAEDAGPWAASPPAGTGVLGDATNRGGDGDSPATGPGKRERHEVARYEPEGGVRARGGSHLKKRRSSAGARGGALTHAEIEGALASQEMSLTPLGTPRGAGGGGGGDGARRGALDSSAGHEGDGGGGGR